MASIAKEPNGCRRIQFHDLNRKRLSIRLGKVSDKIAQAVRVKVEDLAAAAANGHAPTDETVRWLNKIDAKLYAKLAKVGLVAPRDTKQATLGAFLESYIGRRSDVKGGTVLTYENVRRNLLAHFSANKPLRSILPGHADEFAQFLARSKKEGGEGLGRNTTARRIGVCKQFFRAAVRHGLIKDNPFQDLQSAVHENTARDYFLSRADSDKIIAACPDSQWRLLFALSRYGGLRCPSEHLALRWADVDFLAGRMKVWSPKTEHHAGQEFRIIPIFGELRPYLNECFDPEAEFVITRYRDRNCNLRTQLQRIIKKAKLEPWPKLFQNLRATRATELANEYPAHVAAEWMGHDVKVATKHYWRTTEDHFEKAVHQTVQQPPAATSSTGIPPKPPAAFAGSFSILPICTVGPVGFKPTTKGL